MNFGFSKNIDPRSEAGKKLLLLFLGLGLLMLIAAGVLFGLQRAKLGAYVKTEGEIVSLDSKGHPTVRFQANGGTVRHAFRRTGSSTFRVGDRIGVAYDPADPQNVILTGLIGYLAPLILGAIGLGFAAVGGICYWVYHGKRGRKKEE